MYYGIMFLHFLTRSELKGWEMAFLIFEHFLIFMTVWSYLTTYFTDPGRPPVFWVRLSTESCHFGFYSVSKHGKKFTKN